MGNPWYNKASFGLGGMDRSPRFECRARSDQVIHAETHREAAILQ
jgi:hypothetical protein